MKYVLFFVDGMIEAQGEIREKGRTRTDSVKKTERVKVVRFLAKWEKAEIKVADEF